VPPKGGPALWLFWWRWCKEAWPPLRLRVLTNLDHGGHAYMPEHTTSSSSAHPVLPPLLSELLRLLDAHRCAFRQERTFLRAQALLFGHLFSFARHTITQALVALGLTECDWSAFYRLLSIKSRIDYEALSGRFFREILDHIAPKDPFVAVVDGVQVPRHSHKMASTSWLKSPRTPPFMPGIHRAQRFMHLAALLPKSEEGYSRAIPLRWEPAFPKEGHSRSGQTKEGVGGGSGGHWVGYEPVFSIRLERQSRPKLAASILSSDRF
jgi:hypothetical protein